MPFELSPILEIMIDFYQKPRTPKRFQDYLALLTDRPGGDIVRPIGLYNPMAREHVLEKLRGFARLGAEQIIAQAITAVNQETPVSAPVQVVLALADDAGGGWTHRFTTDYAARFQWRAMIRRGFCTPLFWASESDDAITIAARTREALRRAAYQHQHGDPKTLEEHLHQEAFASENAALLSSQEWEALFAADDYPTIFAALYGEDAARELGIG